LGGTGVGFWGPPGGGGGGDLESDTAARRAGGPRRACSCGTGSLGRPGAPSARTGRARSPAGRRGRVCSEHCALERPGAAQTLDHEAQLHTQQLVSAYRQPRALDAARASAHRCADDGRVEPYLGEAVPAGREPALLDELPRRLVDRVVPLVPTYKSSVALSVQK
jgi:hypothetical protein